MHAFRWLFFCVVAVSGVLFWLLVVVVVVRFTCFDTIKMLIKSIVMCWMCLLRVVLYNFLHECTLKPINNRRHHSLTICCLLLNADNFCCFFSSVFSLVLCVFVLVAIFSLHFTTRIVIYGGFFSFFKSTNIHTRWWLLYAENAKRKKQ